MHTWPYNPTAKLCFYMNHTFPRSIASNFPLILIQVFSSLLHAQYGSGFRGGGGWALPLSPTPLPTLVFLLFWRGRGRGGGVLPPCYLKFVPTPIREFLDTSHAHFRNTHIITCQLVSFYIILMSAVPFILLTITISITFQLFLTI